MTPTFFRLFLLDKHIPHGKFFPSIRALTTKLMKRQSNRAGFSWNNVKFQIEYSWYSIQGHFEQGNMQKVKLQLEKSYFRLKFASNFALFAFSKTFRCLFRSTHWKPSGYKTTTKRHYCKTPADILLLVGVVMIYVNWATNCVLWDNKFSIWPKIWAL